MVFTFFVRVFSGVIYLILIILIVDARNDDVVPSNYLTLYM